jgi:hypothetical protein
MQGRREERSKMISESYLKGLGFETMEELYQYIFDSKANGQLKQTREIVSKLSHKQHIEFIKWVRDEGHEIRDIYLGD